MRCPKCDGKGYREYEAGLIQVKCQECNGTGEMPNINHDSPDDHSVRDKDTPSSRKPRKRKVIKRV